MIVAIVLLLLLGVSLLMNFSQLLTSSMRFPVKQTRMIGPRLEEKILEDHASANKVAVIEVEGIITSQVLDGGGFSMVDVIRAMLRRAEEDARVKAVILRVNSPGGEVLASDEIYQAIARFQKESGKPVVSSMGSLAASGGYYISAPCQWIVANDLTITGSIGVILQSWNYRGLMNKVGLHPIVYKTGIHKDMLSGSRDPEEIPAEEKEMLQNLIEEVYVRFKKVVAEGREWSNERNEEAGRPLSGGWEQYADGRVLSGSEAHRLGMVDELGNFDVAFNRAKNLARVTEANLVRYEQRFDLSDFFRLFGETDSRVLKVDLGVEAPKLQPGQMYFLSPTMVH